MHHGNLGHRSPYARRCLYEQARITSQKWDDALKWTLWQTGHCAPCFANHWCLAGSGSNKVSWSPMGQVDSKQMAEELLGAAAS